MNSHNYNTDPKSQNSESVRRVTNLPVPPGTAIKYRNAANKYNSLDWSAWKTDKTTAGKNSTESAFSFHDDIPVFSFAQDQIIVE